MSRDFDGSNDYIDCGSGAALDNLSPLTVTAWVRPDTITADENWIYGRGSTVGSLREFYLGGFNTGLTTALALYLPAATAAGWWESNNVMTTGEWQFVAATYDGGTLTTSGKLYRATVGAALAELTYSRQQARSGSLSDDSAFNDQIGKKTHTGFPVPFDGRIADVRVWNAALSLAELQAVMRGAVVRPDALKGWWPLFGAQSPEPDWSGNNNHGTVTEAVAADHPPGISAVWLAPHPRRVQRVPPVAGGAVVMPRLLMMGVG